MDFVCVLDKTKAELLKSKGFNYTITEIDNKTVYKFLNTPEMKTCLNSNFSNQEYFVIPYMNF